MKKSDEEIIWDALRAMGLTKSGTAGVMGNLQAESGLSSINLQNTGNAKLGVTDQEYTDNVDKMLYYQFPTDWYGYGLCQWTSSARKRVLESRARDAGVSVGDLNMQLSFLCDELMLDYREVFTKLCATHSVQEAASVFMLEFERPADKSVIAQQKRGELAQTFYEKYRDKEDDVMRYDTVASCPDWAKPTIQRMVDNEELSGTGQGLDLTLEMVRTFVCVEKMLNR